MKKYLLLFLMVLHCGCYHEIYPPNTKSSNLSKELIREQAKKIYNTTGGVLIGTGGGVTGEKLRLANVTYNFIMQPPLPLARFLLVVYSQELLKEHLKEEMQEYLLEGFGIHSLNYRIFFYNLNHSINPQGIAVVSLYERGISYLSADYHGSGKIDYVFNTALDESYEEALAIVKRDFPEVFSGEKYNINTLIQRAFTLPSPIESEKELTEYYIQFFKDNPNLDDTLMTLDEVRKLYKKQQKK